MRSIILTVVLTVLLIALAGCTPWATYPAIEGAASISDPQLAPIPELMAKSIIYGHEHHGAAAPGEPIVFNLPTETPPIVWEIVEDRLGNARPMAEGDHAAFHVQAVRVRGLEGEVDLLCPRADGHYELLELKFERKMGPGLTVVDARRWRVRVPTPQPTYESAPAANETVVSEPTASE